MASASDELDGEYQVRQWTGLGLAAKGALALAGTFISVGLFSIAAALPPLGADFANSANATLLIQLIGSIAAPVFALASPGAGRLVAKFGVRTVYIWSAGLFALAGIAPAVSHSLIAILAYRMVVGLAVAGGFTAGMVGIACLPERERHVLYGLAAFIGGGVSIIAYPAVGSLAETNWRMAFLIHLVLLPAILLALFLPPNGGITPPCTGAKSQFGLAGIPPKLLMATAILGWAMISSSIYLPFYLAAKGVTDPGKVGFILSLLAVGSLVGSGSYKLVHNLTSTRGTTLLGMLLVAVGCAMLAVPGALPIVTVGLGFMGAGLGMFGTAVYPLAIESLRKGGDPGAATGMVSLALYLPQVLFPIVAGAVEARFGAPVVYALLALLIALAIATLKLGTRRS